MHPALWISKTGLDAHQTNIDIIAHNLANASTTGYKETRPVFEDLLYQNVREPGAQSSDSTQLPNGLMLGTGARIAATQKTFRQGELQTTNNALDMAINGRGFFQVLMPDGTIAYTRDGQFSLDNTGQIVTSGSGYVLQPAITIPQDAQSITIGNDGTVSVTLPGQAAPSIVGNIEVANFINPSGLEPMGENLFRESQASGAPSTGTPGLDGLGKIMQNTLETSNVSAVEELVNLIEAQRTYEMNAKVIAAVDQMLQFVNQTI